MSLELVHEEDDDEACLAILEGLEWDDNLPRSAFGKTSRGEVDSDSDDDDNKGVDGSGAVETDLKSTSAIIIEREEEENFEEFGFENEVDDDESLDDFFLEIARQKKLVEASNGDAVIAASVSNSSVAKLRGNEGESGVKFELSWKMLQQWNLDAEHEDEKEQNAEPSPPLDDV